MANGNDEGYLVPADAPAPITLFNVSDFVSMDELGKWGDGWIKARHLVYFLDCCFSGLSSTRGLSDGRIDLSQLLLSCFQAPTSFSG